jgi:hypothetical protein
MKNQARTNPNRKPRPEPPPPPGPRSRRPPLSSSSAARRRQCWRSRRRERWPRAGGPPAEIAEAEAAAFAEADANDDGFLTEAELATFHTLMREKIDALRFDRVDSDDDGLVSLEELQAARPSGPRCGGDVKTANLTLLIRT